MSFPVPAWRPWLRSLPCTASGRPKLREDEVELRMLDHVELMDDSDHVLHKDGVLVVTNQRLMYMTGVPAPQATQSGTMPNFYIDLRCVARIWAESPWFRWPRMLVRPGPINAAILHPSQINSCENDVHLRAAVGSADYGSNQPFSVTKVKSSLPLGVYLSAAGDYLPPQHNRSGAAASAANLGDWSHLKFAIAKAADRDQILKDATQVLASVSPLCKIGMTSEPYGGSTAPDAAQRLASSGSPRNAANPEAAGASDTFPVRRDDLGFTTSKNEMGTSSGFGIAGILRKREIEQKKMDAELKEAFGDLTKLMEHAQRVVQLSERIAQQKQIVSSSSKDGTASSSTTTDTAESSLTTGIEGATEMGEESFRNLLSSMGITSPVTKASAGGLFHAQIAMQLIDFLEKPVALFGGVMTLTDVYSLYCRARGMALISPEDLLFAARRWETIEGCPLRLKKFSGTNTLVVCSADFDEGRLRQRTLDLLRARQPQLCRGTESGATAYDLSKQLRISIYVVNEILVYLEHTHKSICRDVAPEGIYYYLNYFLV